MFTPVILLAFANASEHSYLAQLKRESAILRDIFLPLEQSDRCKVIREESVENSDIPRLLAAYPNRFCIFHYGGHADGKQLHFEDRNGRVSGLAALLGLQKNMKLVFLNGCNTQEQAKEYISSGIPAVLATTLPVLDSEAVYYAEHFYNALAQSHTLENAFLHAGAALRARSGAYDGSQEEIIPLRGLDLANHEFRQKPWCLYFDNDRPDVLNWRLPQNSNAATHGSNHMEVQNNGPVKNQINNPIINGDLNLG